VTGNLSIVYAGVCKHRENGEHRQPKGNDCASFGTAGDAQQLALGEKDEHEGNDDSTDDDGTRDVASRPNELTSSWGDGRRDREVCGGCCRELAMLVLRADGVPLDAVRVAAGRPGKDKESR
jgi:hypothetical protein